MTCRRGLALPGVASALAERHITEVAKVKGSEILLDSWANANPLALRLESAMCFYRRARGSYGLAGANSPAQARSCSSQGDAPASWAAIIFSGSMYVPIGFFANSGEFRRCSPDVQLSP
jgi:hypothetical protein